MFAMRPIFGFAAVLVILSFANTTKLSQHTTCFQGPPGLPGHNGIPGHNGVSGRDGRDGAKGERGQQGQPGAGAKGEKGSPGGRGQQGQPGAGTKGEKGSPGGRGQQGQPGAGAKGEKGSPGLPGRDAFNWKQCAWRNVNDETDIGLIRYCIFTKKQSSTALRVVYQANFLVRSCKLCCKRWFITFNGAECRGPLPIDAVLWVPSASHNVNRPGSIEGYCENIHKGTIRVGINVGNCPGYGNSDAETAWNSVSRLIIEEVPPSQ